MNKILIVLLFLSVTFSALAAGGFSSLEEQMTGKEFTTSGLDKLSPQELEVLNDWIRRHSIATLDSPAAGKETVDSEKDRRGLKNEHEEQDLTEITSTLVGKFKGWDGQTTFKLANGMIWVQTDKDKFYIKEIENPTVIIKPSRFGSWRLNIVGFNSECRVKRIQ